MCVLKLVNGDGLGYGCVAKPKVSVYHSCSQVEAFALGKSFYLLVGNKCLVWPIQATVCITSIPPSQVAPAVKIFILISIPAETNRADQAVRWIKKLNILFNGGLITPYLFQRPCQVVS